MKSRGIKWGEVVVASEEAESSVLPRGDEHSLSRGISSTVCLIPLLFHCSLIMPSPILTVRQRRKAVVSTPNC
jgi:hypothetical protein